MTRPVTSSRVLLVEHRPGADQPRSLVPLRRYRLARLRFAYGRPAEPDGRFECLKRGAD